MANQLSGCLVASLGENGKTGSDAEILSDIDDAEVLLSMRCCNRLIIASLIRA